MKKTRSYVILTINTTIYMSALYYSNRVRPYEIDSQGIVHLTNYLIWAECSRFGYAKKNGLDIFELASKKNIDLVIKTLL